MRTGDWFQTFTGRQFYLTDPHPDDVDVKDIAHALSMACRFGGHTREFYSVDQHCVLCAWLVRSWGHDLTMQLDTLLHDASEAYIGDVVRPLKISMPDYCVLEKKTMSVIYQALKLSPPGHAQEETIKRADNTLLMTERRDLINHREIPWGADLHDIPPVKEKIQPWSPAVAEMAFLSEYNYLRAKLRMGVAST